MGKINKVFEDKLVNPIPDRFSNRVKVQQAPNGEVTIHFRNFKIVLLTPEEIAEWRDGFREALRNLRAGDYLKNDI